MTAVPEGQGVGPLHRLLEVQHHDTAIDQLRHRRDTLPARASLRDVETRLAQLDARTGEVRGHRGELAQRQAAIETQIDQSRTRKSELEKRMFGGQVTAPRELQAMDEEVRHLARHISDLEDRELELMEAIEPLDGDLQAADVERDALEKQASELNGQIADEQRDIDAELREQEAARAETAASVPGDLLGRYEQLRKKLGGTGAAALVGSSCSGCHLTLPAMEVDRIRKAPPDEVITCDQCGRILVR